MICNDDMIPQLHALLKKELKTHEPSLSPQEVIENGHPRQALAFVDIRYFIAVLENHIFSSTVSVIFTAVMTGYCYKLRFYMPLTKQEHEWLSASNYTPALRSKVYLTVGLGTSEGVYYAYAEVKISQYGSASEVLEALPFVRHALEKFLTQ